MQVYNNLWTLKEALCLKQHDKIPNRKLPTFDFQHFKLIKEIPTKKINQRNGGGKECRNRQRDIFSNQALASSSKVHKAYKERSNEVGKACLFSSPLYKKI